MAAQTEKGLKARGPEPWGSAHRAGSRLPQPSPALTPRPGRPSAGTGRSASADVDPFNTPGQG